MLKNNSQQKSPESGKTFENDQKNKNKIHETNSIVAKRIHPDLSSEDTNRNIPDIEESNLREGNKSTHQIARMEQKKFHK